MLKKKGFILTLLMISVPLLTGSLMVLTALIFCIRNHDHAQKHCLQHTLYAQENIKIALKKLLKLNPNAKKLRKKHKTLNKLYKKALTIGEPISISILKTKLIFIKKQRIALDLKQKYLLNQTTYYVSKAFNAFQKKIKTFQAKQIIKKHHQPYPLAVTAQPKGDIAPVYQPKTHFAKRQTLSFSWKMPLYHSLPITIKNMFFKNQLSSYHCSATIKKQKQQWQTTLTHHQRLY